MRTCFNIIKNFTFYIISFLKYLIILVRVVCMSFRVLGYIAYFLQDAGSSTQVVTGIESINGLHAVPHPNFN